MGYTGEQKREYQLRWRQARRNKAIEYLGSSCADCGSSDKLEFDHIDRKSKAFNIAHKLSCKWETLEKELDKCQLLCEDCHKAKTTKENSIDHPHGNVQRYDKGCRCSDCRASKATSMRKSRSMRGRQ